MGDVRAAGEEHTDRECHRSDPVSARPRASERGHARAAPHQRQPGSPEDGEQHRELILRDQSDNACGDGQRRPSSGWTREPACDQEQRQRCGRICGRFLDEDRRVRERRREPRPGGGEQRPTMSDHEPREPVGGKHGRRHDERTERLDQRIRGWNVIDPPERCAQVRGERRQAMDRLAAKSRVTGCRERPRELRHLDLVGEDGRRRVVRRLPQREPGGHRVDGQ